MKDGVLYYGYGGREHQTRDFRYVKVDSVEDQSFRPSYCQSIGSGQSSVMNAQKTKKMESYTFKVNSEGRIIDKFGRQILWKQTSDMSWDEQRKFAESQNGSLLTTEEAQAFIRGKG